VLDGSGAGITSAAPDDSGAGITSAALDDSGAGVTGDRAAPAGAGGVTSATEEVTAQAWTRSHAAAARRQSGRGDRQRRNPAGGMGAAAPGQRRGEGAAWFMARFPFVRCPCDRPGEFIGQSRNDLERRVVIGMLTDMDPSLKASADAASSARQAGPNDVPVILAEGLRKSYGPVQAVRDLSLQVCRGEILGLLGPNGAGKSTALRMLIGFQYPDAGRVAINGRDVLRDGPRARAHLGYLPEMVPLYRDMSVRVYLEYFARLRGVHEIKQETDRVIERLDLSGVTGRPCGNLSRGYRQRVGLAQALLGDPQVLILDEPTSGLDPNQIHDFRALVRHLGRDHAVLLSTHILPEAMEVCDRVLIMSRGAIVATGRPGDLMGDDREVHWARVRIPHPAGTGTESGEDIAGVAAGLGLRPESPVEGADRQVYRLNRPLRRAEAQALLRHVLDRDWEILEWGTGASGLEAVFRRLTLGEEP